MTALPVSGPEPEPRLLTVAEYAELGETENGFTELQEGHVLMSPSPTPDHNAVTLGLALQLVPQMPADAEVLVETDIDLELAGPDKPGFSRRPDLIVVDVVARRRVRADGGLLRADEVRLVVEVVSPGSRRMDNVIKHGEYADAGIPHYWIVDLESPLSLHVWHLAGDFGYQDSGSFTGDVGLADPFPITLGLDRLG